MSPEPCFYVDGAFVEGEAFVPITDRSFLYGDGCFEGISVRSGRILYLEEHLRRLAASARLLRISMPVGAEELRELVVEVARRNAMGRSESAYLRVLLSRGSGYLGLRHTSRLERPHLYVIPQHESMARAEAPSVTTAAFTRVATWPANSLDPRIKANNYLAHILALLEAQDKGAEAAIHCDRDGFVTEGHAMNVFCVRGGRVSTPPEASALAGITRAHVLHVARAARYPVDERSLTSYDLLTAEEVFLTGSLDGVVAVRTVEGEALSAPVPGPVTSHLYRDYLRRALDGGVPVPGDSREVPAAAPSDEQRRADDL
jgi:branched-chain amino acid aminotransferase